MMEPKVILVDVIKNSTLGLVLEFHKEVFLHPQKHWCWKKL